MDQSGFRRGHSTETALLSVTEALRIAKADSKSSVLRIYLLLLTMLTIRFYWPPSHHWASLGFHFAGLNPISLVGLSRWPVEGRYPKHINWSLGFLRNRFLDPSSSPQTLHHWVPSYKHMFSPIIAMLMTQLYLSFQPDDPTVAARISGCLTDISAWMKEHHLQLNLAKTEHVVFPATPTLQHGFTIQLSSSTITLSSSIRNHCTTSERSSLSLHRMQHNFLSRPLSFQDWTTAMLFWLDVHKTQSNLYKWFRMQQHDWSSANPKGPMLHLSLSPCTGSRLQLTSSSRHWCLHIEQPQAQHLPTSTHLW